MCMYVRAHNLKQVPSSGKWILGVPTLPGRGGDPLRSALEWFGRGVSTTRILFCFQPLDPRHEGHEIEKEYYLAPLNIRF